MSGIASVRMIVNMQLSCNKQLSGGLGHPKYLDWVTEEVSEVYTGHIQYLMTINRLMRSILWGTMCVKTKRGVPILKLFYLCMQRQYIYRR